MRLFFLGFSLLSSLFLIGCTHTPLQTLGRFQTTQQAPTTQKKVTKKQTAKKSSLELTSFSQTSPGDADHDQIPDETDPCPYLPGPQQSQGSYHPAGCPLRVLAWVVRDQIKTVQRVDFEKDSAQLSKNSLALLDQVATILRHYPYVHMRIEASKSKTPQELLRRRLQRIHTYLVQKHIDSKRLQSIQQTTPTLNPLADLPSPTETQRNSFRFLLLPSHRL